MATRVFLLLLVSPSALALMLARCPEGWVARGVTDQCYYVHGHGHDRTFEDARAYCQARGGDLAYIDSTGLRDWLGQLVAATGSVDQNAYAWVGAERVGDEWQWLETNQTVNHEMLPWDGSGSGDCAALTIDSKLIQQECSQMLKFICHRNIQIPLSCDYTSGWEDVSGRCYKKSTQSNSWHDSEVECAIEGGHLVRIESDAEQMLAHDLAIEEQDKIWIGYTEESHAGEFTWIDGSNSSKTYWHEGQPDLSLNGFGAAVVDNDDPAGLWMVERITNEFHALCEKPVGSCLPGWEVFERSCYYFNTGDRDTVVWDDAKNICESVNAEMLVLDTDAEDTFFRTHMPEGDTLWIGLYSKPGDGLYWTDGTPMASRNFSHMTSEDESSAVNNPDKQCVYLQETLGTDGVTAASAWVPAACYTSAPRHYACEAEAGAELNLVPPNNERYCPEGGWLQLEDYCYFFGVQEKSWTAAEADCNTRHSDAHLASIHTWAEQDFVNNNDLEESKWIGLNSRSEQSTWVWNDGSALTITNWNTDEPEGFSENCVEMYENNGFWNNKPCSDLKKYVCKMPASTTPVGAVTTTLMPDTSACGFGWTENPENGECYRIELQSLIFYDAQLHCNELHYDGGQPRPDLLSIQGVQEQNFVFNLLASQYLGAEGVWIGMRNTLTENEWTDGTPSAYFNFGENKPNDLSGQECVEMELASGEWDDENCLLRRPFVCEKKGKNYVGPHPPPRPQIQCPDEWTYFDNHCYYFSSEMTDWFTADASCNDMLGSSLTSVTNQDENDFVQGVLEGMLANGWLGLRDNDKGKDWHWTDGSPYDWTNWGDGEPNNADGGEHCGQMKAVDDFYDGQWDDADCDSNSNYVCKISLTTCPDSWVYKDGKCYYVSESKATRNEGQVKCQEENTKANLVNIHSEEENQFFREQLKQGGGACWTGLQYNGSQWVWADGTEMEYTNWNTGEPNNLENEECGVMVGATGKWRNKDCSMMQTYGCELYPTHAVGCEDAWEGFGDYCYWYSLQDPTHNDGLTFDQAQQHCESLGANLVSIHTAEENDFVESLLSDNYVYTHTFIGLSDVGHKHVFTWNDGTDVVFTNFDGIYYTDMRHSLLCVVFDSIYRYSWIFENCDESSQFLCKKPKEAIELNPDTHGCQEGDAYHGSSCYSFPGPSDSWDNARSDCEGRGQHLVSLGNQIETAYFSALVGVLGSRVWLGLKGDVAADGSVTFTWVTGEPLEYTYWDKYEPDPNHGTCVSASGDSNYPGLWATGSCSDNFEYACEYERVDYTTPPPPTTRPPADYCLYGWQHKGLSCYQVMLDAATWGDGENRCGLFGGHLASVGSKGEEQVLLQLPGMEEAASQYGSVWVGLKRSFETGYEWTDGSATDYVNWAEGQPDSHDDRESCVSADATTLSLSDSVYLTHLPLICEAPAGSMLSTAIQPTKPPVHTCSDDASWYLFNDHCYKFVSSVDEAGQTWWEAHLRCRDDGGELASIVSSDENYWIESMIYENSKLSMWTGGRAKLNTGYEWLDGQPFTYDNWASGEPNNVNDQEDCISIYTNNYGYWNDQNCGHTAGRICKRPHGSTHPPAHTTKAPDGHCPDGWIHAGTKCVYFITEWTNFTASREVCRKMGNNTDLASIHSAAEQAYLTAATVALDQHVWIGMRYESGFVWVDQTSVTYTNWGPDQPDGEAGEEECVAASSYTGLWSDVSCSNVYGGICMMTQDPDLPHHHALDNCPPPHDAYISYNGACYRAVDAPQTWEEAEATCAGENAHLVSMVSISEDSFVWAAAQQNALASLWTGLTNKKNKETFAWSDGWPTTYTNWGRNEPVVNVTKCVAMAVATDGAWYTKTCGDSHPFICKHTNETVPTPDPPSTGHCPDGRWKDLNGGYCYLFSNDTRSWDEANRVCLQEMSNLASIHSAEEMKLLQLSMETYSDPVWIGLVDISGGGEGWSDGTSLNYINWQDGQPNSGEEQCTEMVPHSGEWNDAACAAHRYYLCKANKVQEPTDKPPVKPTTDEAGGGGGGGGKPTGGLPGAGIAGIVIAVLLVLGVAGFVGYSYIQKHPKGTSRVRMGGGGGTVEVAAGYDGIDA